MEVTCSVSLDLWLLVCYSKKTNGNMYSTADFHHLLQILGSTFCLPVVSNFYNAYILPL